MFVEVTIVGMTFCCVVDVVSSMMVRSVFCECCVTKCCWGGLLWGKNNNVGSVIMWQCVLRHCVNYIVHVLFWLLANKVRINKASVLCCWQFLSVAIGNIQPFQVHNVPQCRTEHSRGHQINGWMHCKSMMQWWTIRRTIAVSFRQ